MIKNRGFEEEEITKKITLPIEPEEINIKFILSDKDILFIKEIAEQQKASYEEAVVFVIKRGIDLIEQLHMKNLLSL